MAWRLDRSVIKGEFDNRIRGLVKGRLWLLGRNEPIVISLKGNGQRDIAGCLVTFENLAPESGDMVDLNPLQTGVVGDLTASRKVRVLDVSVEEAMTLSRSGQKCPEHMGNCLYFEWFSESNGRVVIESVLYRVSISTPEWTMSPEEELEQISACQDSIRDWMADISDSLSPGTDEEDSDEEPFCDAPMDEFEWERSLKESDAISERFAKVLEKYIDHPDRDRLVAQEMGWDWIDETLAHPSIAEQLEEGVPELEEDPVPNPRTEGVDWVRTERGRITHPLTERTFQTTMQMWHYGEGKGFMGDPGDPDFMDMVQEAQTLSAKLAGALDNLGYEAFIEGGFIVACLKRSLQYFDRSIAAMERVRSRQLADTAVMDDFRKELFGIREEILRLIAHFRERL